MAQQLDALKGAVNDLVEKTKAGDQKTIAAIAGTAAAVGAGALLYRRYVRNAGPKTGGLTPDTLPAGAYDAVIVGAGPSGSVCANYACQGGAKVALLDKATFPRGGWRERGGPGLAGPKRGPEKSSGRLGRARMRRGRRRAAAGRAGACARAPGAAVRSGAQGALRLGSAPEPTAHAPSPFPSCLPRRQVLRRCRVHPRHPVSRRGGCLCRTRAHTRTAQPAPARHVPSPSPPAHIPPPQHSPRLALPLLNTLPFPPTPASWRTWA
jgi:hypothetical protein